MDPALLHAAEAVRQEVRVALQVGLREAGDFFAMFVYCCCYDCCSILLFVILYVWLFSAVSFGSLSLFSFANSLIARLCMS